MRLLNAARYGAVLCSTGALLSGCGGFQPPAGAPATMSQSSSTVTRATGRGTWMLPEAKSEYLLYVGNIGFKSTGEDVTVYSYPQGKLVGSLKGFKEPRGLCINNSGDVWVTDDGGAKIVEYAHGGTKPIATLPDDGLPYGCAIDPTTGNLAVMNWCDGPSGSCFSEGTVLIYKHAKGKPEVLNDPDIAAAMTYCAYDKDGNLFVDSYGEQYQVSFAELPARSKTFQTLAVKLPKRAEFAGGLQWVGKYLAVGFGDGNVVGEYTIKDDIATRVRATLLKGVPSRFGTNQFWVEGTTLVAPVTSTQMYPNGTVEFFKYPQGGKSLKVLTASIDDPFAAVVSPAKSLAVGWRSVADWQS